MATDSRGSSLRAGRFSGPGTVLLATAVTRSREPLFRHLAAGRLVLDTLVWLGVDNRVDLFAAVVMPDHVHAVMMMRDLGIDRIMHSLKSYTANRVNLVLDRSGPVWQRGYHEKALRTEKARLEAVDYCLYNPVRARLVEDFHDHPLWWCAYPV